MWDIIIHINGKNTESKNKMPIISNKKRYMYSLMSGF